MNHERDIGLPAGVSIAGIRPELTLDFLNRQYAETGQSDTHADINMILGNMLKDRLRAAQNGNERVA